MLYRSIFLFLFALLLASFLIAGCHNSSAQDKNPSGALTPKISKPRTIAVSGKAEISVAPDEVLITLSVETLDKDVRVAQKETNKKVKTLLDITQKQGIPAKKVQTDYISVSPKYRNYQNDDLLGYQAFTQVKITLVTITKLAGLLSELIETGSNRLSGISFYSTQDRKYRDQARILAVKACKEKATLMANELGQKVGRPLEIKEEALSWWSGHGMSNVVQERRQADTPSDFLGSVAPGQIKVSAKINIQFELTD